jgi:hypothetical protein
VCVNRRDPTACSVVGTRQRPPSAVNPATAACATGLRLREPATSSGYWCVQLLCLGWLGGAEWREPGLGLGTLPRAQHASTWYDRDTCLSRTQQHLAYAHPHHTPHRRSPSTTLPRHVSSLSRGKRLHALSPSYNWLYRACQPTPRMCRRGLRVNSAARWTSRPTPAEGAAKAGVLTLVAGPTPAGRSVALRSDTTRWIYPSRLPSVPTNAEGVPNCPLRIRPTSHQHGLSDSERNPTLLL